MERCAKHSSLFRPQDAVAVFALLRLANFPSGPQERPCENWSAAPNTAPCFVRRTRSLCLPLALSQFSRRAAKRPCENWSAAPNTAPCFIHRMRSLCLPLLRLACFYRRQRLGSAAKHASLFLPQAALRRVCPPPFYRCPPCRCAAVLLRLAGFCGGRRCALEKIGALLRVAVSQIYGAGRGPLVYLDGCPCSASAVSAAGSASAAQPASPRCFCRRQRSAQLPPFGGS